MKKNWVEEVIKKEKITKATLIEKLKIDYRTLVKRLKDPYSNLSMKDLVILFNLLEEKGYSFKQVLEGVVGTKYKGKKRLWFELDNDEYENK